MTSLIASLIFAALIAVLLVFTRERGVKVSAALWLTFAWLWFASSRNPSLWLQPHGGGARSASSAYDEGDAFDRNILTGIMLVGVIVLARRSQRVTTFLTANFPIILFFLYCGMSAFWSDHPDVSIRRWFRGLGDLLMVMVVMTDVDWVAAFKWVYVRLACFLVPLSILFFRYFPDLGRNYDIHDGHVSVTGVSDDKNALGIICMLFALAVGWSMLEAPRTEGRRDRKMMIGYGLILAMAIYILWIADSATASACLIQAGGLMILTRMPKIATRPLRTHLLVAAILGFSALNLFAGSALLELLGRNSTLTGRTDLWAVCLPLVTNPLFGAGYESFWLGSRLETMWRYIYGVNQAHNGYIEIYLNLGWVGVMLLVGILISGYRNIVRAVRRQEPAANLRLAIFVAACVYNCTEAGFKMMHPMWIALLMVSTARPVWNFAHERSAGHGTTPGESSERPGFLRDSDGKNRLELLARKGL
jgi:exopolysaccharide production protein ExoQ